MKEVKRRPGAGSPQFVATASDMARPDVARGLEPESLDAVLLEANAGDPRRQARLVRDMMERDWTLRQAWSTRVKTVRGCQWHLQAGDGSPASEAAAERLEAELRGCAAGDPLRSFYALWGRILESRLTGYSLDEALWVDGGRIAGFAEVRADCLVFRDGRPLVATDGSPLGAEIPPGRFIYSAGSDGADPWRGGIARPLAWLYVFANLGVKDMMGFVERHGMPFIVGKVDSQAWQQERNKVKALIRNFGPSGGGVFTRNVELELLETHSTGDVYFRLLGYLSDAVEKLVLGQTASSGDGGGLSKDNAQAQVRQDILEDDCRLVETVVDAQVLARWTAWNMPSAAPPHLSIECQDPAAQARLATTVQALSAAGYEFDEAELTARFGLTVRRRAGLPAMAAPMGGEAAPAAPPREARWLGPMRDALARLLAVEDPGAFGAELERLSSEGAFGDSSGWEGALRDVIATGVAAGAAKADARAAKAKAKGGRP